MNQPQLESSLTKLRQDVFECDQQILLLIAKRLDITRQIGQLKQQLQQPIKNPAVETKIKQHYAKLAHQYGICPKLALRLHRLLLRESRKAQRMQKTS